MALNSAMKNLNSNPVYRILVPKAVRTFMWKRYLKQSILKVYKDSKDTEVLEVLDNIKKHGVSIIPANLEKTYLPKAIHVEYDSLKELSYVNFDENKKLYFNKKWSTNRIQKALNQLLIEQDPNSPHRYLTKEFNVDENTIVADIGCAEANFSLEIVDKVKHIYLFEANNLWDKPLHATFEKYKDKVTIVNKKFSTIDSENSIDGNKFLKNKGVNFLKIDVDGHEVEVMESLDEMIRTSQKMKIAFCTYHAQDDFEKYSNLLLSYNYAVTNSKGFMIYYWDKKLSNPFLRRGLLRAKK